MINKKLQKPGIENSTGTLLEWKIEFTTRNCDGYQHEEVEVLIDTDFVIDNIPKSNQPLEKHLNIESMKQKNTRSFQGTLPNMPLIACR